MLENALIMMNDYASIYLRKQGAEYEQCQTFKVERFEKGRDGRGRGGGRVEVGPFDKGTS